MRQALFVAKYNANAKPEPEPATNIPLTDFKDLPDGGRHLLKNSSGYSAQTAGFHN